MQYPLIVHIPQNESLSYTLYVAGVKEEPPQLSDDKSEYIFTFTAGTPVVLFYNFENIKRVFVVTAWQDERDGKPVQLPGVEGKLHLIYQTKGTKIRLLNEIITSLTQSDEQYIYTLPLLFWYRLSNIIQYKKGSWVAIQILLDYYKQSLSGATK